MPIIVTRALVRLVRQRVNQGFRIAAVAREAGCSESCVYSILRRLRDAGGDISRVVSPRQPVQGSRQRNRPASSAERYCEACGMTRMHIGGRCVVCAARTMAAGQASPIDGPSVADLELDRPDDGEQPDEARDRQARYLQVRATRLG